MFVLKSTHQRMIDERDGALIVIARQNREIDRLEGELQSRQVPAVRGARGRLIGADPAAWSERAAQPVPQPRTFDDR